LALLVASSPAPVAPLLPDSLVDVKGEPAVVSSLGKLKVEVLLTNGKSKKVNIKDVKMIFPGPVRSWEVAELAADMEEPHAAVVEAHAYLSETGECITIGDLASTIFEETTFKTVWAAWKLVSADLYFHGAPDAIAAHSQEHVDALIAKRAAEEKAEAERVALVKRVKAGKLTAKDKVAFKDVEDLALMRSDSSSVLKMLGMTQTPDVALGLLLEQGLWTTQDCPWPERCGVPAGSPALGGKVAVPGEERVDLTHLRALAIDDADAEDPDDAITCEEDGKCWVHVADVAAVAGAMSELDEEARRRVTSVYLPTGTVPMLPEAVAEAVGMGVREVSPALSFGFRLEEDGTLADIQLVKSLVRVERLTYEAAAEMLEADDELLTRMEAVADAWRDVREAGGAIGFNFPDVSVKVDEEGGVSIKEVSDLRSKDLVTEFMLMAGAAASTFALDHDIPFLFCSQGPPSDAPVGKAKANQPLAKKAAPAAKIAPTMAPQTLSAMFDLRKRLVRSQVKAAPGLHSSLGMERYAQVTSPLRRYGDLVLHQQLRAFLDDKPLRSPDELEAAVAVVEEKIGNLKRGERMAKQWYTLAWLMQHPDWKGEAICVGHWQPKPHAPRIGQVLIPELGLLANVRLREDVKRDEGMKVKLRGVRLVDMRADWTHIAEAKKLYGTKETEEYQKLARARKNVGTRMSSKTKRQG